jgi:hypothetical protein
LYPSIRAATSTRAYSAVIVTMGTVTSSSAAANKTTAAAASQSARCSNARACMALADQLQDEQAAKSATPRPYVNFYNLYN